MGLGSHSDNIKFELVKLLNLHTFICMFEMGICKLRCLLVSLAPDFFIFIHTLGLGSHLFVEVPGPRNSEGTVLVFESNCHLLPPV